MTKSEFIATCKINPISAIKELRAMKNWGLKDSKDAIDLVRSGNYGLSGEIVVDEAKAGRLYDLSPNTLPTAALLATPTPKSKDLILRGIRCACNNWQDMGFSSITAACRTVLDNLENHA